MARAVDKDTQYYIHGVDRLSANVRKMSAIACVVAFVAEDLVAMLNKSKRVLSRIDAMERVLKD